MSLDIHAIIHSSYTFIRSIETNKSVASLTLDHMISEEINRLKKGQTTELLNGSGDTVGLKPSRWDQLDQLQQGLDQVIQLLQSVGDNSDALDSLGLTLTDDSTRE